MLSERAIEWFSKRGISKATLSDMKVSEGEEWMPQTQKKMNTIQFNYYFEGELINTKFRDGKKNFKLVQGAPKIFYNLDSIVNSDTVVIVEGEIDALSVIESGVASVVSVPNGATLGNANLDYLDDAIDLFDNKQKVILALDNDEPGQTLQQEFIRRLGPEICYVADFDDCKDANEYLVAHGGVALKRAIDSANVCPLDNVVVATDIKDEIEDFIRNGFKQGYQIGLPGFDEVFSTYTGQFITVTGIPTHGKSNFVDRMCVGYNMNYGWKTAYASPENLPLMQHATGLIRKKMKMMPRAHDIGTDQYNKAFGWVTDNFYWIDKDRYYLDEILEKGAELVRRKGIKVLVIDPFNKVSLPGKSTMSIPDYTMEYLSKIDEFCRKYDVLTILVAHPTKMYKDEKTGKMQEPNFYNVKGGGEFFDASYHGICVHRDFEEETVDIRVMKVKFQNLGTNGAKSTFTWDKSSGDYIPVATGTVLDIMGPNVQEGVKPSDPTELDLW